MNICPSVGFTNMDMILEKLENHEDLYVPSHDIIQVPSDYHDCTNSSGTIQVSSLDYYFSFFSYCTDYRFETLIGKFPSKTDKRRDSLEDIPRRIREPEQFYNHLFELIQKYV